MNLCFPETTDQSKKLSALLSNTTYDENNGLVVHRHTDDEGLYVELKPPRLAQFVVIRRETAGGLMTICEVEVFEGGMLVKS